MQQLAADLSPSESKSVVYPSCFACGATYSRGDGRFCSSRCRAGFDAGIGPYEPQRGFSGPPGVMIHCYGCKREFRSLGLRCCSSVCEKRFREQQDDVATLAKAGIERAVKKTCELCDAVIPKWTKGKLTRKDRRFCSEKCEIRARRHDRRFVGGCVQKTPDFIDSKRSNKNRQLGVPLC
jgi:hypothetical protein